MGLIEQDIMDILFKHSKLEYSSRGKNQYIPSNNYDAVVADIAKAINTIATKNNFHVIHPTVAGAGVDRWRLLSPNLGRNVPVLIMDTTNEFGKEHVDRKTGMTGDLKSVNEDLFKKLGEKLSAEMYSEKLLMDTICPDDEDQQQKKAVKPKQPPKDSFITGKKLGRKKPRKR